MSGPTKPRHGGAVLSAFAAMVRHTCPDDGDVRLADEAHDYLSGCMQAAKREWEATLSALDAAEDLAARRSASLVRAISDAIDEGERRAVAERERDDALAAFAMLREAARSVDEWAHVVPSEERFIIALHMGKEWSDRFAGMRAALAAAPSALADQYRARVSAEAMREAADAIADTEFVPDAVVQLRGLAHAAERGK